MFSSRQMCPKKVWRTWTGSPLVQPKEVSGGLLLAEEWKLVAGRALGDRSVGRPGISIEERMQVLAVTPPVRGCGLCRRKLSALFGEVGLLAYKNDSKALIGAYIE